MELTADAETKTNKSQLTFVVIFIYLITNTVITIVTLVKEKQEAQFVVTMELCQERKLGFSNLTSQVSAQTAGLVTISMNHPYLASRYRPFIRMYLWLYYRYSTIVLERARQLSINENISTEACRSVSLKYCVCEALKKYCRLWLY